MRNLFLPPFSSGAESASASPHARHVFISHAQASAGDLALALSTALLHSNVTSWYDKNMIPFGLSAESMKEGVRRCSLFCLIVSKGVFSSAYVRMEIAEALSLRKRVVLLFPQNLRRAELDAIVEEGIVSITATKSGGSPSAGAAGAAAGGAAALVGEAASSPACASPHVASAAGLPFAYGFISLEEELQRSTVLAIKAALRAMKALHVRLSRPLDDRLGTHMMMTRSPASHPSDQMEAHVLLVGCFPGCGYLSYLRNALLLACPTMRVEMLEEGAGRAAGGAGQRFRVDPASTHVIALLEPALFSSPMAVATLEERLRRGVPHVLSRVHLLFDRQDRDSFKDIIAASPPTLLPLYSLLTAAAIQRELPNRWDELVALLAQVGACERIETLPIPELPPLFEPSVCAVALDTMRTALVQRNSGPSSSAVSATRGPTRVIVCGGRGGLGKTAACCALALDEEVRSHFDDVHWLTIGRSAGRSELRSALVRLVRALGATRRGAAAAEERALEEEKEDDGGESEEDCEGAAAARDLDALDLDSLTDLVRNALESLSHRTLVVLDDLSGGHGGEHLRTLAAILPDPPADHEDGSGGRSRDGSVVLVTARDVDACAHLLPAEASPLVVRLEALPVDVATDLLSRASGFDDFCGAGAAVSSGSGGGGALPSASDDGLVVAALRALAEEVGRSPYALQLVARILRQISLDEYGGGSERVRAAAACDDVRGRISAAVVKPALLAMAPDGGAPAVYRTIEVALSSTFTAPDRAAFSAFGLFAEDADVPVGLLLPAWGRKSAKDRDELLERLLDAALVKRGRTRCVQLHDFAWDFAVAERGAAANALRQAAFLDRAKAALCVAGGRGSGAAASDAPSTWAGIGSGVGPGAAGASLVDSDVRAYLFRCLPTHMRAANRHGEFTDLLFSLDWLVAAGEHSGIHSVLRDIAEHARFVAVEVACGSGPALALTSAGGAGLGSAEAVAGAAAVAAAAPSSSLPPSSASDAAAAAAAAALIPSAANSSSEELVLLFRTLQFSAAGLYDGVAFRERLVAQLCGRLRGVLGRGHQMLLRLLEEAEAFVLRAIATAAAALPASSAEAAASATAATGAPFPLKSSGSLLFPSGASPFDTDAGPGTWLLPLADTARLHGPGGALEMTLVGHAFDATSLCTLPDGMLASSGFDGLVKIWRLSTGECVGNLVHADEGIKSIVALPGGLLASATDDELIRIWQAETGSLVASLVGHTREVLALCAMEEDGHLASSARDRTIRIWQVAPTAHYQCIRVLSDGQSFAYASCLCSLPGGLLVSGGSSNSIVVWNVETGKRLLASHSKPLEGTAICVCPIPDVDDSGGPLFASGHEGGVVKIWSPSSEVCIRDLGSVDEDEHRMVMSVCPLPGGLVAAGSSDCFVRIWRTSTGECVQALRGHGGTVLSVCALRDGRLASASDDKRICIWRVAGVEASLGVSAAEEVASRPHSDVVECVCILLDGLVASASRDGSIKLWSEETGACVRTLWTEPVRQVFCLCALSDGLIASCGDEPAVRIWDTASGECVRKLDGHSNLPTSICALPGGRLASSDDAVRIWRVSSGVCDKVLVGHTKTTFTSLCSLPDGLLASASLDKCIRIWNTDTGECVRQIIDAGAKAAVELWPLPGGLFAAEASNDVIRVWNPATGSCVETSDEDSPRDAEIRSLGTSLDGIVRPFAPLTTTGFSNDTLFSLPASSFAASARVFLDAGVHRAFPAMRSSGARKRPVPTVGVFTDNHQFLLLSVVPVGTAPGQSART